MKQIKHYYARMFLLHLNTVLWSIVGLSGASLLFIAGNQKQIMPYIADYMSRQRIPFNLIVSKKNMPKLIKIKPLNLNSATFTQTEKKQAIKLVDNYASEIKTSKNNLLNAVNNERYFTQQFADNTQYNTFLHHLYSNGKYVSLNSIIPTGLGSDKKGKYIIVDYIMQSDDPKLYNYQAKMYLAKDTAGMYHFTDFKLVGKMIANKGGLNQIYAGLNNSNSINNANTVLQQFYSKLDLSNVYNDKDNLNKSSKFINLTNGYNSETKSAIMNIIQNSEGSFTNFGIVDYTITDVPNQIKMNVDMGGTNQVFHYLFTYNVKSQEITDIKIR